MCHGRSDGGCQKEGKGEIVMKRSVTRKIDELGRIVIPSDFREALGVKAGEKMEVYVDGETLCCKKLKVKNSNMQIILFLICLKFKI